MDKPNVKMVRVDARLIHGQGQLWIKSLGVNLVI
ncbi:MAG: PTS sugar transporter subunit IIB, partial [Enterococcus thailandicus]|nr:PTS sugar transporter subunit IIB [Enterococcus thailandicus]